jgi:superfamily I DNA and/or RNA helicase
MGLDLQDLMEKLLYVAQTLSDETFDMVIIDEAAQALEATCWIPILKGRRLVLAGDHKQLAPTIKSSKAATMGLGTTLFDRLMSRMGPSRSRMLTVQYRMHATICGWASHEMYEDALTPAESVASREIAGLEYVTGEGVSRRVDAFLGGSWLISPGVQVRKI